MWFVLLNGIKRFKYFIPTPFKFVGFTIRSMIHLDKNTQCLQELELNEIDSIQGYNPQGIFNHHMVTNKSRNIFPSLTI